MPTRLTRRPPPLEVLLAQGGGLRELMASLALLGSASHGDRYLHWDDLRHRTPPEGLTHEQWWLAETLARRGNATTLPLLGLEGHPFWFCQPPLLLRGLYQIDRQAGASVLAPKAFSTVEIGRAHV